MKQIRTFILVFLSWALVGQIGKIFFLLIYSSLLSDASTTDRLGVLYHGLPLDFAIAGYLTIIPGLVLIVNLWYKGKVMKWIWTGYFMVVSLLSSIAHVANLVLYGYWGYPLDSTPLLYIKTSPTDAMASATMWQMVTVATSVILITTALTKYFTILYPKPGKTRKKTVSSIVIALLTAFLIIPIRGGFDTGTNHTGTVYFSDNIRLNHAAVNPIFCFVESVSHQHNIGDMYRFMENEEATTIADSLKNSTLRNDSTQYLTTERPNVVIVMLESFSKYVMDESGKVKGVTPCLTQLTKEGIYFDHFYANSVRTDRAMVSILSGFPAQPTLSIMDTPQKSTTLPSIARTLGTYGYTTSFYYGGDTNYSNMRSYYMGTGYEKIVEEKDFAHNLRTSKWGVADGPVYDRMFDDIKTTSANQCKPFLVTMMTESSHEPFDVPYKSSFKEEELNAFAYADECLGKFIDRMKKLPCWRNTVVIIVPDHLGAYPRVIDNYALWRYEIPLIFTGGAVKQNMRINTIGCQTDIAATLLGMMNINHDDFEYSRDMLDKGIPHFAFFTVDDGMGMVTDSSSIIYDNVSNKVIESRGKEADILLIRSKAYLQKLFDDINAR